MHSRHTRDHWIINHKHEKITKEKEEESEEKKEQHLSDF